MRGVTSTSEGGGLDKSLLPRLKLSGFIRKVMMLKHSQFWFWKAKIGLEGTVTGHYNEKVNRLALQHGGPVVTGTIGLHVRSLNLETVRSNESAWDQTPVRWKTEFMADA